MPQRTEPHALNRNAAPGVTGYSRASAEEVTLSERSVVVASSIGLHARPASLFTRAAADAGVIVTLTAKDRSVNAASILGVLSLGVEHGESVTISAEGDGADAALDSLVALLATDLDAQE
jgi:phosphocarrier protein HPr